MVIQAHLEAILQGAGEPYVILPLQATATALITQRGGRILGLFPAPDAANLLWTNASAFASVAAFQSFVTAGHWNLGGERIWIAPEIQYNVHDRNDFWGTLRVPPALDPAAYELHQYDLPDGRMAVRLDTGLTLTAHNLAAGEQILSLKRLIVPIPDPLRAFSDYAALMQDVRYAGYEHQVRLAGEHTTALSEAWNLVQLNAGGQLIIPCMPVVEASDYFGSVPDDARQVQPGAMPHLRISLTGRQQFKIGYKAFSMTGCMAYWQLRPDGSGCLLIRSFFNNPSNVYAEEPPHLPGANGHSVHVYNDGGEFGGAQSFGEMECTGRTIRGGHTLEDTAQDTFVLWAYVGQPDALRRIAHVLTGVRL